jgi:hypothetical protein
MNSAVVPSVGGAMQVQQEREQAGAMATVSGPGWHRGGETQVWRGGHVVQAGLWGLFRPEVDGNSLELVALVEAGESGWTWEVALVGASWCGAKTALAAMDGAVEQLRVGAEAGRARDQRRAAMLLRRWSAGVARAA